MSAVLHIKLKEKTVDKSPTVPPIIALWIKKPKNHGGEFC